VYNVTAKLLAHGAVKLATDGPRATGVLAPASAFDADWLLKKAGLEADFAVLRTTGAGRVMKDVPNQQFNHAIVYVRKQPGIEQGFFIDPTTDALDLGSLRSDDQGAVSLVLEPEGNAWRFEDIPFQAPELERWAWRIQLDPLTSRAHIEGSGRGTSASASRRAVRDAESEKKFLQNLGAYLWPGSTMVGGTADTSEDIGKPFTLAMDADISGAMHEDTDGVRIDPPKVATFAGWTTLGERRLPLKLGVPDSSHSEVTLVLPRGRKLLRPPPDYHIAHACFRADRTTTVQSGVVRMVSSYTRTCPEISPTDYPAFRVEALKVVSRERDPIVLSKAK
jgi:hypothetical protein